MIRQLCSQASRSLVVTGACLWAATVLGCAERAIPPLTRAPTATIVAVEGAGTTYHTRDWNGKTVTVRVPSQSVADIKDRDADGTVQGTITSVHPPSHQVKVRTSEGQTVVLAMTPGSLAGLKVGDRFIFTIPEAPRT